MYKNLNILTLILCFGLSSVQAGLAADIVNVPPVLVDPYDSGDMSQQVLAEDRINRDQELAIKGLMEQNQQLSANSHDPSLQKANQTMTDYQKFLILRDRARIITNAQRASKYFDLIRLTEDVDDMKDNGDALILKRDVVEEKYKVLMDLKNEMLELNERLSNRTTDKNTPIIEPNQETKIQILTQRLSEMDQKISHYDEIIAEKDREILQLKTSLSTAQTDAQAKDDTIKDKENQIEILKQELDGKMADLKNASPNDAGDKQKQIDLLKSELEAKIAELKDQDQEEATIKDKQQQIDSLKTQLNQTIIPANGQDSKDAIIKQQESEIADLKAQSQELSSRGSLYRKQADQVLKDFKLLKDQSVDFSGFRNKLIFLRNKLEAQAADLKSKDDSILLLNRVLAAYKSKVAYYQLTSQINQLPLKQVQEEVKNIKADFAQHFKDYNEFEDAIISLKQQVSQLTLQLNNKEDQIHILKLEMDNKTSAWKSESQEDMSYQQELKAQLAAKEEEIVRMRSDLQAILQNQANKEIYRRNTAIQVDDRIKLAQQLIDLQSQETALLEEKDNLAKTQNTMFDQHARQLENQIKALLVRHQIQTEDLENRLQEMKSALDQKQEQAQVLENELKDKIAQEKNQSVLLGQIQDLKSQLQTQENQMSVMKAKIEEGQQSSEQVDSLKQQLVSQQDKVDQLKEQLDAKVDESNKMAMMIADDQKKIGLKDNAVNAQARRIMMMRHYQAQMEKQIADLNAQLQEKESEIIHIKKDMYDLQESSATQNKEVQTNDLNLSMQQQVTMDAKIKEYQSKIDQMQVVNVRQIKMISNLRADLAIARQEILNKPNPDELEFLREGLKKATMQLKQRDQVLGQIKGSAQEYEKAFKEQTKEFESLKDQLKTAQDEIASKDEDLKYKDMAVERLNMQYKSSKNDFQSQVLALNLRLDRAEKKLMGGTHENKVEALQSQLKNANAQIADLEYRLNQLKDISQKDIAAQKLKQALDKIDQQGKLINILVQKLQDSGKSVNLAQISGND